MLCLHKIFFCSSFFLAQLFHLIQMVIWMFNWQTFYYLLSVNSPSLWKAFLSVWCHISFNSALSSISHYSYLFLMTMHSEFYRIGLKSLTNIDMMVHWIVIALFFAVFSHLYWAIFCQFLFVDIKLMSQWSV